MSFTASREEAGGSAAAPPRPSSPPAPAAGKLPDIAMVDNPKVSTLADAGLPGRLWCLTRGAVR